MCSKNIVKLIYEGKRVTKNNKDFIAGAARNITVITKKLENTFAKLSIKENNEPKFILNKEEIVLSIREIVREEVAKLSTPSLLLLQPFLLMLKLQVKT